MNAERVHYGAIPQTARDLLDEVYLPEGTEMWWNARNRLLDGKRPRDLWLTVAGRRLVMETVDRIADGNF